MTNRRVPKQSFELVLWLKVLLYLFLSLATIGCLKVFVMRSNSPPKNILNSRVAPYFISDDQKHYLNHRLSQLPAQFDKDIKKFTKLSTDVVMGFVEKYELLDLKDLFRVNVAQHSALLLSGLPVDQNLPACPTELPRKKPKNFHLKKTTQVSEALLMAFGTLAGGQPVGYTFEPYSHPFVHHSCPRPDGSNFGSAKPQNFHCDMCYLRPNMVPDILALACVREGYDPTASTEIVDNRDVLKYLTERDKAILRQARFTFKAPDKLKAPFQGTPRPILTGPHLAPAIALPVDWSNMIATDRKAEAALIKLRKAVSKAFDAHGNKIYSKPGDLLIFNNRRVLHRRAGGGSPRNNGYDRTLFRAYFSKNILKNLVRDPEDSRRSFFFSRDE